MRTSEKGSFWKVGFYRELSYKVLIIKKHFKKTKMKRTLLAAGVLTTLACSGIAYAYVGLEHQESRKSVALAAQETSTSSADAISSEDNPGYGVSIGTVEAQLYSESGLSLNYFNEAEYVAKTTEGTYWGFRMYDNEVYDEESGNYKYIEFPVLIALSSTDEFVTIPDNIKIGDQTYPVAHIGCTRGLRNGFINSNVKRLTVPASVEIIGYTGSDRFDQNLEAMYMLGSVPQLYVRMAVPTIYVCDKSCYAGYMGNDNLLNSNILPYGWDFEWITVNVEKNGEFAETYLTQNNYDWGAGQYVKVTGNINDIDLSAIKNLTSLVKLDLSETSITSLPERFMYNRTSLREVMLPTTMSSIGNSAFDGCAGLQAFELKGIDTIGQYVFRNCRSLSYINLTGVKSIGDYAFYGCSTLNNIDLSTVAVIGNYTFYNCVLLEAADLTSAVAIGSIDSSGSYYRYGYAFYGCSSLKNTRVRDKR